MDHTEAGYEMENGWNWLKTVSSGRLSLLVVLKYQLLLPGINSSCLKEVFFIAYFIF